MNRHLTTVQGLIRILALVFLTSASAQAQSISLLRDAEMEALFRDFTDPVLEAAGLTPQNVHLYFVADNSLNAFVTGGQNIFVHTGLILEADHVNQVIGVMAHEACHIACAHRIASREAAGAIGNISIISMVLGAAAIVAGSPDAGIGLIMGGQSVGQYQYLAYNRGQESEADIAGARYLQHAGFSPMGLIEFFEKLRDQEVLALRRQDPYLRTHPLNRTRIQTLEQLALESPYKDDGPDPELDARFQRIKAKLYGYMNPPSATLAVFPLSDTSTNARYARAYAFHKALEWDRALMEADALIAAEPANPYFHEIKGQILFENQRVEEAIAAFDVALQLAPDESLIAAAYGQAVVTLDGEARMRQAIPILTKATRLDPSNTFAWYNLARAYGRMGESAMANLATAERYYHGGALPLAFQHARRALPDLQTGSREWLRAQDIVFTTERAAMEYQRQQRNGGSRRRRLTESEEEK